MDGWGHQKREGRGGINGVIHQDTRLFAEKNADDIEDLEAKKEFPGGEAEEDVYNRRPRRL